MIIPKIPNTNESWNEKSCKGGSNPRWGAEGEQRAKK